MLYINDKPITEVPKTSIFRKHYDDVTALFLKEFEFPVVFKFTDEKVHHPKPGDLEARVEKSAGIGILMYESMYIDTESAEIRYFQSRTPKKGGGYRYSPRRFDMRDDIVKFQNDWDLIYFLVFVSPHCQPLLNQNLVKYQNSFRRRSHFILEDRKNESAMRYALEQNKAKVTTLLFEDQIGLREEVVLDLAEIYHIPGSGRLPLNEIKLMLRDKLLNEQLQPMEQHALLNDFLNNSKYDRRVQIMANINRAKSQRKLTKITKQGIDNWAYMRNDETMQVICKIRNLQNPEKSLLDHFLENEEAYEIFETYVETGGFEKKKDDDEFKEDEKFIETHQSYAMSEEKKEEEKKEEEKKEDPPPPPPTQSTPKKTPGKKPMRKKTT